MEFVEFKKDKEYMVFVDSTNPVCEIYYNMYKALKEIGVNSLIIDKKWLRSNNMKNEKDVVNSCKHYSKESLVTGFVEGDVEDPVFEEAEICNKPGCVGYCPFEGIIENCEVIKNEEEED